jgi:hypothetical protein
MGPHEALDGKTPAEMAGLDLDPGENKWMGLIKKATGCWGRSKSFFLEIFSHCLPYLNFANIRICPEVGRQVSESAFIITEGTCFKWFFIAGFISTNDTFPISHFWLPIFNLLFALLTSLPSC